MKKCLSFVCAIAFSITCVNVGWVHQVDNEYSPLCDESYAVTLQ